MNAPIYIITNNNSHYDDDDDGDVNDGGLEGKGGKGGCSSCTGVIAWFYLIANINQAIEPLCQNDVTT